MRKDGLPHHAQSGDPTEDGVQIFRDPYYLLAAAARITSLSDTCQRLRDAPSDETARQALLATLPDYATLQRQLNAALAGRLPKALASTASDGPST